MMLRNFVDIALFFYVHMNLNYTIFVDFYSLYKKMLNIKPLYRFFCWLVYIWTRTS